MEVVSVSVIRWLSHDGTLVASQERPEGTPVMPLHQLPPRIHHQRQPCDPRILIVMSTNKPLFFTKPQAFCYSNEKMD